MVHIVHAFEGPMTGRDDRATRAADWQGISVFFQQWTHVSSVSMCRGDRSLSSLPDEGTVEVRGDDCSIDQFAV